MRVLRIIIDLLWLLIRGVSQAIKEYRDYRTKKKLFLEVEEGLKRDVENIEKKNHITASDLDDLY